MQILDVAQAVEMVADDATVLIGGSGAGHAVPQGFIDTLATTFREHGHPRDLTTVRVVGIGDFGEHGFSQLAQPGLMRRTIGSNIGNEPMLGALVEDGAVEAYSFPQGVLSQLCREIAGGRPGLITNVGLGTYVDPRQTGGRQGPATTEDLVEVVELAGSEWLFFPSLKIDVAVIRGTTADEDGNLTMEDEAIKGEMLAMAMAARNSGGVVIAEVKQIATRGSLDQRAVEVPGSLINYVYVQSDQRQTYHTKHSPYLAGHLRQPSTGMAVLPLDVRKAIARRSLLEFDPGAICNLGFGISQQIGSVAAEEGVADDLVLTVEQGVFGGVPLSGPDGGAGFNYQALIDQPYMFDFYDGGGLDVASLSFAEVDHAGNVNVHAFAGRLRGPGGFLNISARTPTVCFVGTFTAKGLAVDLSDGRPEIVNEGGSQKFVPTVREISFSAERARQQGQRVLYITERAVFTLGEKGVTLIEVADGIDVEQDVIAHMGFRPAISSSLKTMDPRLFDEAPMGLSDAFAAQKGNR